MPTDLLGAKVFVDCTLASGPNAGTTRTFQGTVKESDEFTVRRFIFDVDVVDIGVEKNRFSLEYQIPTNSGGLFDGLSIPTFLNPLEFDFDPPRKGCSELFLTINLERACKDSTGVVFDIGLDPNTPGSSAGNLVVKQEDGGTCGALAGTGAEVPVVTDFIVNLAGSEARGDLYFQYKFDLSGCDFEKKIVIFADTDRAAYGQCTVTPGVHDDPHFDTFGGQHYDFQGACDLVLVDNAGYKDGKGLFIHGRTALFGSWSSLVSAAVKIGDDVIEVHGEDLALINGVEYTVPAVEGEHAFPMTIGGYSLTVQILGPHSRRHIIHMGEGEKIFIDNFKEYVNVFLEKPRSNDFELATGMWGTFGKHGAMMARDGVTIIEDGDAFGNEWQVHPADPQLFHIIDGPQYPAKCIMPEKLTANQRHLRAMYKKVSEDDAKKACSKVSAGDRMQNCIADVFGSDNLDMAGIYAH